MKYLKLSLLFVCLSSLTACITPIGKEEFTCPNAKKGGVCAGPREIYELTNDRENLNDLGVERAEKEPAQQAKKGQYRRLESGVTVYEPRSQTEQHTDGNYQKAKKVTKHSGQRVKQDDYNSYPSNQEPVAPEPLAVLTPAKVMRVLIASYKDKQGNLNMPGYVYVQVEEETWSIGEAANTRPTRVVPLEIRNKTQEEERKAAEKAQGVSPLEYMTGGSK